MMKTIVNKMIKAIKQFNLIENGDTVAVGLSGGKDSLLLLKALKTFQSYKMIDFNLIAITIDFGRDDMDFSPIKDFCKQLDVPYFIEPSQIYDIVFNVRKEKNPCSLCAKMRRGALCNSAIKLNANKLALGHHADDLVETFMLSFIFEGRLSTFSPKTLMSRTNITVIRPFVYVSEQEVIVHSKSLPVVFNPCPANKNTKRQYVKNLIAKIKEDEPCATENLTRAITNPQRNNLWKI